MNTFVKVCGVTTRQHIDWAVDLGYDAIGLMMVPKSPRALSPQDARELAAYAGDRIIVFAVGLEKAQVEPVLDVVDVAQLYEQVGGIESLALASAEAPDNAESLDYWFYDVSHGSGKFEPIPSWVTEVPTRVVLSGGLDADNVAEVVEQYRPFGIDVSSGVEKIRGVKDFDRMQAFIEAIRAVDA